MSARRSGEKEGPTRGGDASPRSSAATLEATSAALVSANQDLRDRLRELSAENESLREHDRIKDAFVSSVSHELRTPLTSIRGFAEILLDYGTDDPAVSREFLTIIRDESERLGKLIRNVLDLSRLDAGQMQWEIGPVDLEEVVEAASDVLRPQIEAEVRKLTLSIPEGLPAVRGDRDGLIQVFVNLLGNATKFTRAGGSIAIVARVETDSVLVSVTDDGIGIPESELTRIFERFRQVGEPAPFRRPGTGLGLAICKEIVGSFGGDIWAESGSQPGSSIFFRLPMVERGEPGKGSLAERAGSADLSVQTSR